MESVISVITVLIKR